MADPVTVHCEDCGNEGDVILCVHCLKTICSVCAAQHWSSLYSSISSELQVIRSKLPSDDTKVELQERREKCQLLLENIEKVRNRVHTTTEQTLRDIETARKKLFAQADDLAAIAQHQTRVIDELVEAENFQQRTIQRLVDGSNDLENLTGIREECNRMHEWLNAWKQHSLPALPSHLEFIPNRELCQNIQNYCHIGTDYRTKTRILTTIDGFSDLWDVAVHPETGEILTADGKHILIYMPDGQFVRKFTAVASCPRIAVDGLGRVVVTSENNNLSVYDTVGSLLLRFGGDGSGKSQFGEPSGVACDTDNNIYLADSKNSRIQVFQPNGTYLRTIGEGRLKSPTYVAVDKRKYVYVTERGRNEIAVFDHRGGLWKRFGRHELVDPKAVCVDDIGRILVASDGKDRVDVFAQNGYYCSSILDSTQPFLGGSSIWGLGISGLALTKRGELCVVDRDRKAIHIL